MFGGQTRSITGDVQMANRASSRLWVLDVIVGVKEKGVISKGTGGCPALSFSTVVKKSKWHLQHENFISFIPLATPMFKKQKTIKTLFYVSRTKTSPLALCHDYSQGFVLGPLLFTDTLCADDVGLFVSSKSIHSI